MADVVLKDVTKIFERNIIAADNISFEVKDKEFVVLVGPSGCGKSTTLRLIAGLEELTEGEIYIDGRLVNDIPPKDRDIAMVFQNYALYPHMTVYHNMAFGLKLRKYPRREIERRVHEAAEILGITDLLNRKPKALSGGEQQRVAVGRAIVRKPKVFLFDEPLSNLDAKLRVQMRAEICKLHSHLEATIIYVTHDQVEAMTMGQRIVVMRDGVIQQIDTPLNLYNRPANKFVAGFIGSPTMNFIQGTLSKDWRGGLSFSDGVIKLGLPRRHNRRLQSYVGRELILGIRPEDILNPRFGKSTPETVTIWAKVEVIEPMGNETFLYLNTGSTSLVARFSTTKIPRVGEEMKLMVNMSKCHFFDKDTEIALL
ncbi:MAG TPA: sn-glycerol-3-phosphate ABC transporter ATP-binding protein UgpC [Candidatus Latescibacteria bacterium]|nr:sn-glycerol-3-phosphate ABC transporter ATP-binding protein UgpC [Candidatus Latescibacterota bacterium]